MKTIKEIQENFRMILGEISVDELVGNTKIAEKIELIHQLFVRFQKRVA